MSAKSYHKQKRWMAATLIIVSAVTGCAFSNREIPHIDWVAADENRIAVTSGIFDATRPIGVKYTDSWQTEEYGLFRAGGRQLEMIYAKVIRAFTVALDYQMPIEEMVATWNLNSRQNLVWGSLGRIDSRFGTWFYRTYESLDLQRSCFGFLVEWDQIYEDPRGRPGKVLFGYFCGAEGEVLEDEAVRALIRGIRIGMPEELPNERDTIQNASDDKEARLFANGGLKNPTSGAPAGGHGPSIDSGNPRFPFMFARYYSESGGGGGIP